MQFDMNSQYVMTNSVDCQILVFEMSSGFFRKIEAAQVKDVEWYKKSSIYAWDTLGVWGKRLASLDLGPELKESDINSVSISKDKKLLCVGDSNGKPRLFCYPAYLPKQAHTFLEGGHI